jgi:hypothetical protein
VSNAVAAVNSLVKSTPSVPATAMLDLRGGKYTTDTQVKTHPGVALVIENGTLHGGR